MVSPELSAELSGGTEARGLVQPADFDYPFTDLHLDRDVALMNWKGDGDVLIGVAVFRESIPPGGDTSEPELRDDDPSDSDPIGCIYDLVSCSSWNWNIRPFGLA
jgi:hypothetical protein